METLPFPTDTLQALAAIRNNIAVYCSGYNNNLLTVKKVRDNF